MQVETFGVLVVVLVIFAFLFLKAGIKMFRKQIIC